MPGFLFLAHNRIVSTEKQPVSYRRAATFERAAVNLEARTAEVTFSSEAPVRRRYGNEVLDHASSSVRMQRLNSAAPLLWKHDTQSQEALLGVVERAWIGDDRRGHAIVRFGRSPEAERALQDASDGILRNVSVGYSLHDEPKGERGADGVSTFRFKDWEPYEVSLLPIPADHGVGVGREFEPVVETEVAAQSNPAQAENKEEVRSMSTTATGHNEAVAAERERVSEINAIASRYGKFVSATQRDKFVSEETAVSDVRKFVMDAQIADAQQNEVRNLNPLGLSESDVRRYSLTAAIRAAAGETAKGYEHEVSEALAKATGRSVREHGLLVPANMQMRAGDLDRVAQQRGMNVITRANDTSSSNGNGAATIFTEFVNLIDLLRNQVKVRQMGATFLSGLTGNIAFPKQTGATSASWVADNPGSDVSDSAISFAQMSMTPKVLQASTGFSRLLLQQSSVDVEALIRMDLTAVAARAIDLAALVGTGSSNQPKGILNQTGIGSIVTGGAALTFDNIVEFETQIAEANADVLGTLGYLTTPRVRKKLKLTPELANTIALPIWQNNEVNGYKADVTNQLPKPNSTGGTVYAQHTIIAGVWSELLIGEWVAYEVVTDPFRLKKQGIIEVTTYDTCDINVRHPQAFVAATDVNPLA